jgi:DNA-binding XRE family transcriptional regulator
MTPENFKRYRLMLRMTQEEMAKRLGEHRITIVRYETGAIKKIPQPVEMCVLQMLRDEGIRAK